MLKILFLVLLATLSLAKFQLSHQYWYNGAALKKAATGKVPFVDVAWSYCDLKCLYLENYYPQEDFVVINFESGNILKGNFAACYVKRGDKYVPWNTVAKNSWFEQNCGKDDSDYFAKEYKTSSPPPYQGESRGNRITDYD